MSGISSTPSLDEGLALRALEALERDPSLSQRGLARELGVSLGRTHYCLRALIDKGLVKLSNVPHNPQKRRYVYLLTPQGTEEKTRITFTLLRRKKAEIAELRARVESMPGDGAE